MFLYNTPQTTVNINGTLIGGQPGENAIAVSGSIFFAGHDIVTDPICGDFNQELAHKLLYEEARLAEEYGLTRICDVIGETGQALIKYLKFVLDETDCPIFVDSTNRGAIFEAFRFFKGSKAMNRLIYNSVDYYHREAEFEKIKQLGIKNVVVLAFTFHHVTIEDKLALLLGENWEKTLALEKPFTEGLLGKIIKAGIENILLDVGVLDLRSIAESAKSIRELKERIGLPCGCAPANALFSWQKSNEEKLLTQSAIISSAVAAYNSIVYQGADWILYGPMRCAEWVFPAIGVANSLIAYGALQYGVRPLSNNHPLYKI